MHTLVNALSERIKELSRVISAAEADLINAPKGSLRICKRKKTYQYYLRTEPKDKRGKYIRKCEMTLIQKLAQRSYAEKILSAACKEKCELQTIVNKYRKDSIKESYRKLSEGRQNLIDPYIIPDDLYILQWQKEEYPAFFHPGEDHAIYTEKGEPVRSKSEKIIADKFNFMGIPYYYEKPLYLNGYGTIYPDFTVLNKQTKQEYYWEHFGLMDNPEYCEKAIKKIETLAKNGIHHGKNLILTYETSQHPLSMKMMDTLVAEYLNS